jgi:hypothetical protein
MREQSNSQKRMSLKTVCVVCLITITEPKGFAQSGPSGWQYITGSDKVLFGKAYFSPN